jgi:hypothetical protein
VGFLDKAKAAAEQAAAKAKEGVEDVQLKRELGQAYGALGRKAFELVESGELSHPQLEAVVARIRGLNEKDAAADAPEPAAASDEEEPPDSDEPPATPA